MVRKSYEDIAVDLNDRVATIEIQRPPHNFFDLALIHQIVDALKTIDEDPECRVSVLCSEGKAFCAGQDLIEATNPEGPSLTQIVEEHYNPIIKIIRDIEKPVVAAVNGVAAGAGASIALCCDIVVACESASFIQAFSKIGLIPDSGGTFFLPRLIGMQKATALMMTAEPVSAQEALKMGMIYKVFSNNSFEEDSWTLVSKLALMPTKGLALTKKLHDSL